MTQYFLTVPHSSADEPTMESMQQNDPAELEAVFAAVGAFNQALEESGALRYAAGLHPPSTARTVDATGSKTRVLDQPFVTAEEYVGGFWIIEVANDAEALMWTTRAAEALRARIEVRAVQDPPA